MSHITGCSRPLGEVGLSPRQYTEWNVVGRTRSTGDLSQQGLLPEVYCTACTRGCAHQNDQKPKNPRALCPGGLDSWWHFASPANGHMTVLQLRGPMGFRVLQWCHPMLVLAKRTSYCTQMITLYGAQEWIQAHAFPSPS